MAAAEAQLSRRAAVEAESDETRRYVRAIAVLENLGTAAALESIERLATAGLNRVISARANAAIIRLHAARDASSREEDGGGE